MTGLTPRERQVRDLMVKGWTSAEIGASLGISTRTVECHRCEVLDKYKVRNAVELVRAVYQIGEAADDPV